MQRQAHGLKQLLNAFEDVGSSFVLGAGASWPLVPIGNEFVDRVRERGLSMRSFPVYRFDRDILSTRMLRSNTGLASLWDDQSQFNEEILWHLSPSAVRAIVTAYLCPASHRYAPPQYDVFNLAKRRIDIINFNNDGLASRYCSKDRVINVHGTGFTHEDRSRIDMERWIDIYQEYPEMPFAGVPGLYLPLPEVPELEHSAAYRAVDEVLNRSRRLALVGYSFGRGDDSLAYKRILRVLRQSGSSAVVLSPDSRDLVEQMTEQSKNKSVIGLPLRWHLLAAAILASPTRARFKTCSHSAGLCARCIMYFYDVFLDSALEWEQLVEQYELTEFVRSQVELAA
jgi:hypothetical protein